MENPANTTISRVEAVICSIDEDTVELQIAGSYETFRWPRKILKRELSIGEKIIIELEEPLQNSQNPSKTGSAKIEYPFGKPGSQKIQNVPQKQNEKNPTELRKLLESLIN